MNQPTEARGDALPTVGATVSRTHTFSAEEVARFADLVGDHNPIHLDAQFAATTVFGRPIAHGMLVASLLSALLGEDLPGRGSIYLSQSLRFETPVFVGDTVTATVEVIAVRAEKRIITLHTTCTRSDGIRAISGEAVIKR